MYKVQLFEARTAAKLQDSINEWLFAHKDIAIVQSNITHFEEKSNAYSFYLLYSTSEGQAEALKEMAAEIQPEFSVNVTEINPDILNPTS